MWKESLLFGSLAKEPPKELDLREELASFTHHVATDADNFDDKDAFLVQAHSSLTNYLQMWASQLVKDSSLVYSCINHFIPAA